jgi:hypothetical protein
VKAILLCRRRNRRQHRLHENLYRQGKIKFQHKKEYCQMEIFLISCSNEKNHGNGQTSSLLNLSFSDLLLPCRKKLISHYEQIHGPLDWKNCLRAHERYTGRTLYSQDVRNAISANNNKVLILSALFGLIRPNDLIPDYNLQMKDILNHQCVYSFWREQNDTCNRCILNEVLESIRVPGDSFINLLSLPYQSAFCGFTNGDDVQLNHVPDLVKPPVKEEVNFNNRMGHWKRDYLLNRLKF